MARYKLVSVKFSRREHKKDADGKLMYRDEDGKNPVYEVKSYAIGETVELSPAEAKRLRKDIQPIGGSIDQPTPIKFEPDDSDDDDGEVDPKIVKILAGGVAQVTAYINDHSDDEETLEALRSAELSDKGRKGVLDALNDILGE